MLPKFPFIFLPTADACHAKVSLIYTKQQKIYNIY